MRHITLQQVARVLNRMDLIFDAHAAEKRMIGMFPREIGQELASHSNSPSMSALQKLSMQFAQFIDRVFGSASPHPQIRKTTSGLHGDGKIVSDNLAGDPILNQEWEKITTTITVPPQTPGFAALLEELNREPQEEGEATVPPDDRAVR